MGYATKQVKRRRHNRIRMAIAAVTLGGARLDDWSGFEPWILHIPGHRPLYGYNDISLYLAAAKKLGVKV